MNNEITPRQEAFCMNYATIGSKTYPNGRKSAVAAGYSEKSAHISASKLLKRDDIRERIAEIQNEFSESNNITVDKVLNDLEHVKLSAIEGRQLAVARGCVELQGRYLAMFTDNINQTQQPEPKPMTEQERKAAKAGARAYCEVMSKYPKLSKEGA